MVLTKTTLQLKNLFLMTALLASLTACNEAEFYQKEFLKGAGVTNDGELPTAADIPRDSDEHPDNQITSNPTDPTGNNGGTGGNGGSGNNGGEDPTDPTDPTGGNGGSGSNNNYTTVTESFTQNADAKSKVDILWVIDDSGSMGDEQDALAYNFDAFIHNFLDESVDFRMAITTTDPTKRVDGKMVCDWHVLNSQHAAVNEQNFFHMFKKCIKVGIKGSGLEKGLNATKRFLNHYDQRDNRVDPFLRDDAYLIVVVVSDENDQSSMTVPHYVETLRNAKNNEGLVKLYSIVNTEETGIRWESKGTRYMEASQATGGVVANIKDDFYQILSDFGAGIVDLLDSFSIANSPATNDIKVFVNGNETTEFSFDEDSKSITFNQGHVPAAGSQIDIQYQVAN